MIFLVFCVTIWIVHSDDPFELVPQTQFYYRIVTVDSFILLLQLHFTMRQINPALRFKSMVFYLFYGAAIAFLALFIMGCVAYFFINPAVAFIAVGSFFLIFTCIFIVYFIGHKNDKHIIIDKIFDIIKGLLSKLGFNL